MLALLGAYGVFAVERSATQVEQTRQAEVQEQVLGKVAPSLAGLCATDPSVVERVGRPACDTAAQAAAAPRDGKDGAKGADGRGITGTLLRADGHLIVTFTDGESLDVGQVVGETGAAGRGITAASIANGRLILSFSDGTRTDLGPVVGSDGADGRGIDSTAIVDGRLIVSYTDGTTEDAGPVPVADPPPPPGEMVFNRSDGATETCPRTGGPDTAPVYTCQAGEQPPTTREPPDDGEDDGDGE